MKNRKILITDDVHEILIEGFEKSSFVVDYQPDMIMAEVVRVIGNYEGLIINSKIGIERDLLEKANQLKFIGRLGSGLDHVDLMSCEKAGVAVFRSPEGNANAVGEHCLAMLLTLLNKLHIANRELPQNVWRREENRGRELDGLTIGIIGYGHTGPAFAKKLAGFDVKILVYDKYQVFEGMSSIDEICHEADVISFHIPLNLGTKHMINQNFIAKCVKNPIIINSSRGGILATTDVLEALKKERLSGLCIDVFEDEPLTKSTVHSYEVYKELLQLDHVVASPHIGGWSHRSKYLLSKILLDKILEFNDSR